MGLSVRIDLEGGGRIGPGKVALLRAIAAEGSISAAARTLGMSYRRAWVLVDDLNHLFAEPVVVTTIGGGQGGGAVLTATGTAVVQLYEAVQAQAAAATAAAQERLNHLRTPG